MACHAGVTVEATVPYDVARSQVSVEAVGHARSRIGKIAVFKEQKLSASPVGIVRPGAVPEIGTSPMPVLHKAKIPLPHVFDMIDDAKDVGKNRREA